MPISNTFVTFCVSSMYVGCSKTAFLYADLPPYRIIPIPSPSCVSCVLVFCPLHPFLPFLLCSMPGRPSVSRVARVYRSGDLIPPGGLVNYSWWTTLARLTIGFMPRTTITTMFTSATCGRIQFLTAAASFLALRSYLFGTSGLPSQPRLNHP